MVVGSIGEVFRCNICGNIIEVLHIGKGDLVCCGVPMVLVEEQKEGEHEGKHLPVLIEDDMFIIKIGKIEHPMEEEHYIEWIEAFSDKTSCKKFLSPGDKPEAEFDFKPDKVRMYCNVHGLWTSEF